MATSTFTIQSDFRSAFHIANLIIHPNFFPCRRCSFARYMSGQGFDTWILEVRGAGLSVQETSPKEIQQSALAVSEQMEAVAKTVTNGAFATNQLPTNVPSALSDSMDFALKEDPTGIATVWDESKLVSKLTETFMRLSERLSGFLNEGQSKIISAKLFDQIAKLLEDSQLSERFNEIRGKLLSLLESRQRTVIAGQVRDLSQRLVNIFEEGQRSVSPQLFDLQERLSTIIEDFQKQLDLIVQYNWDFDNYLEEDVPAAMEYIRAESKPKDGKLLAIGHSMGGILLYAMLSRRGCEGRDSGLAAIVTLASSLDYTTSNSRLKLLLPLADPAQALSVPVVPLGALLSAAYPLSCRPPYVLSWLNYLISAEDMMHPELLEKLILNNFCTIPAKLILQLTTAFRDGGLCDRSGKVLYKDHLHKSNVPVLALAGDQDLICPPEAVEETVRLIPKELVTYKVFGEPGGPHYAHYDLVGGRLAVEQVYPCITEFLSHHD
uniref:AB hydrolase-1 domain-containing protein n=1 Tax=Manihot esculenta TaxID=3983 RepID=A0A2C9UKM8_MANES